ncbi:DUF2177 family protein [Psychromarinibacter sp. C21-152]|uniref:DUF2177 family protein n=1 Tax=Psychromarinibacter sediminicola TaxID=3033385 RepID=A0AAE3NTC1_9RHOB|nr:DUF2177 family protein [Psychromarinibacter sediminicola]MDF0602044.1 DUF2177 family protein [Psychromarinibacter sediminicola]
MSILILYLSTAAIFLVLDAIGLTLMIRPLFERHVGDLLAFRLLPAAIFYLFYVAVLVWLVSLPALPGRSFVPLIVNAALFGAVAYGTYEFTNLATLRPWHWTMVAADVAWGTVLTTVAATAGVAITRALT